VFGSAEAVPATAESLVVTGELGRPRTGRSRSEQSLIRGALPGSEADLEALFRRFGPWLGAIVANRAINWARARAARRETSDSVGDTASAPEVSGAGTRRRC
jgi:hypothetical protein